MKLLKLTIINIASIESAVIDFENGALADEACFLICGPTGSGKTTLLDAMCLALYNKTPRIAAASKESYTDLTENFGDEIKIDDPRFLMRRGTDLSRVELVFTDLNEQRLTACWQVERAKRKSSDNPIRKIKDEEWSLCDERGNVICSKVSEMKKLIPERIGLTFEQFCRTTMLAQGEFTKFLRSDEGEKSAILEKLTGTEIYSEISKRIHQTKAEKDNAVKLLQAEIGNINLLSEEEENELTANISQAETDMSNQSKEEEYLQGILNKLKEYNDNETEYRSNLSKLESHKKNASSEEHKQKVQLIADWDHSTEARGWWNEKISLEAKTKEQASKENNLQADYIRLVSGKSYLEKNIRKKENQQKDCESFIESKRDQKALYENVTAIEQLIGQIGHATTAIQTAEEKIKILNKGRQEAEIKLETNVENLKNAENLRTEKQNQWEKAQEEAKPFDLLKLSKQNTDQNNRLTSLNSLKDLFNNYQTIQTELNEIDKNIEQLNIQYNELNEKDKELDKNVTEALNDYEAYQKAYDDVKKNLDNSKQLEEIRNMYQIGDTCPLCGGIIHQLLNSEDIDSKLQPMKKILDGKRDKHNEAVTNQSQNKGLLESNIKQKKEYEDKKTKTRNNKEKQLEKISKHPLYSECPELSCVLEAINTCKNTLTIIASDLAKGQELQKTVASCNNEKVKAEKQVETARKEKDETDKLISNYDNRINLEKNTITTNLDSIKSNKERLGTFIKLEEWENNPHYLSQLKKDVKIYKDTCEEMEQLKKELQPMYSQSEQIQTFCSAIEATYPEWKNNLSTDVKEVYQLHQQWNDLHTKVIQLAGEKKTTTQKIEELKSNLNNYYEGKDAINEERLSSIVCHSPNHIKIIRTELTDFIAEGKSLENNKNRNETRLMELLKDLEEKGYNPDEKDIQTYQKETESHHNTIKITLATYREEYGRNKEKYNNNLKAKESLSKKKVVLDNAREELNKWNILHQAFGSNDGKKFRNIAQSYVLKHLLVGANHYLRQLTDRYELECNPGSLTILIRDKEAGGVTRPTTTISGGEGFLISLSLALGLSSLSKKALAMDTLFIDEGFGTLDHTYLSTVMDTLERLHQLGGKKIGIISHVESLKERITTQIQVIKENNTASRVEVVYTI